MEMVDMVITKNWFSGPKSRSVNNSFQQPDLGLYLDKLGLYLDKVALYLDKVGLYLDKVGTGYMGGKTCLCSVHVLLQCAVSTPHQATPNTRDMIPQTDLSVGVLKVLLRGLAWLRAPLPLPVHCRL